MPYIFETEEEFASAIKQAVEAAVRDEVPRAVRRATRKPYLTKGELMELTGWSARTVEYKKSRREVPFVRHGRTVLFPSDEAEAYLREGYVSAKPQRNEKTP